MWNLSATSKIYSTLTPSKLMIVEVEEICWSAQRLLGYKVISGACDSPIKQQQRILFRFVYGEFCCGFLSLNTKYNCWPVLKCLLAYLSLHILLLFTVFLSYIPNSIVPSIQWCLQCFATCCPIEAGKSNERIPYYAHDRHSPLIFLPYMWLWPFSRQNLA